MLAYRRNFIRLVDKAVRDYTDVRKCVLSLIEQQKTRTLDVTGGRLLMCTTTDKIEDCIITVRRLFSYFERVKSDPTHFPIERLFKKRIEVLEESVTGLRDRIVHLDEHIRSGDVGLSIAPELDQTTTTISLGDTTLPTELLARAIRRFHEFALDFAKHEVGPDGAYRQLPKSGTVKG
jgi:hypothetical protein